jgi:2-haloacid dehalogenase
MNNIQAIVFDLYGTLYDVHSVVTACDRQYPGRGREISVLWRQKQLEYTWLRSLMGRYENFEKATHDALGFTCRQLGLDLPPETRETLCRAYLRLAPFPEVPSALRELRARGYRLAILSNGSVRSIDSVVTSSGLAAEFADLISVDEVGVFKPDPRVYQLAERRLHLDRSAILFVSSNSWDATGAAYYGYATCWINRNGGSFEELRRTPDLVVPHAGAIASQLSATAHLA